LIDAYTKAGEKVKLVDLMQERGISGMRARISETAKWGDVTVGPKIIDRDVKKGMAAALRDIQSGKFARDWIRETNTGKKRYRKLLAEAERHPIEKVGARLRGLMAWRDQDS
jgi:ketol-acid reductoisomerase